MSVDYAARSVFAVTLCAGLASCAQERSIQIADVPAAAIAAAEGAVDGMQIASARVEAERGQMLYELRGTTGSQAYEIEVTADGRVLEVEADD